MVERPCALLDAWRKSWLALSELRILELPRQMKGESSQKRLCCLGTRSRSDQRLTTVPTEPWGVCVFCACELAP